MIRPVRSADFPRLDALIHDCGLAVDGLAYDRWGPVTLVYERRELAEARADVTELQQLLAKCEAVEPALTPIKPVPETVPFVLTWRH